jgi:quercetin dioxygenase-like cupin family protein/DNA-binding XRE family transcriptional regulator
MGAAAAAERPRIGALIRARRRQMGMTLQDVSDAAGVSVGYLSVIERDQGTPSLGTLSQIARHLDVGVEYFVAIPDAESGLSRAGERERFSVSGSDVTYERIAADFAGNTLSSFVLDIPPGHRSETVSHEGEEIVYVLSGRITHSLDGRTFAMSAGDSLHFRGGVPHAWANETDEAARVLWTGTLPMFRPRGGGAAPAEAVSKKRRARTR